TLAGSATDAEGSISSYGWTQVSGPNAALFATADAAQASVSGLVAGTYVFRLTATDNEGASAGDEVTVSVLAGGQQVLSFTLVDAGSQRDLRTLAPGETLNLQALSGYGLNIRANTLPDTVGSVVFNLTGALVKNATETGKPYALFGDKDGLYNAWKPGVGSYTLVATPYAAAAGAGQAGQALSLNFQVVDQPVEIPLANAGPDQQLTLPQNSLVLDGRGSGIPGREESFAWTQVSGPGTAVFSSFQTAAPTVSGLVAGTYVFSLVVSYQENNSLPDQVTVTVLPDPVVVTAYRINAGGSQVSNAIGTFEADNFFAPSPGYNYSVTSAIAGTDNDAMYQNERSANADNGSFSYALPVSPGNYQVVLHFAELYWNSAGQRRFDVALEGSTVLDNFDIYQQAGGKYTAVTETFTVSVTDGTLDLSFSAATAIGGVNRPSLAALEVIPSTGGNLAPTANAGEDKIITLPVSGLVLEGSGSDADGSISTFAWTQVSGPSTALFSSTSVDRPTLSGLAAGTYVFSLAVTDDQLATSAADQVVVTVNPDPNAPVVAATYRINAGGSQVNNSIGTFAADAYFSPAPGYTFSVTSPIAATGNDAMYQDERSATADNGSFSYALPLSNGRYKVVLHFAELYWSASGKRIFDVNLEGNLVLDNYDIYKKAGAKFTAVTESLLVNVSDGTLNLAFSSAASAGGVNRPSITAIEVIPNMLPLVQAGPDQQLSYPASSVTLSGSASDPDGSIVSYSWTKESGPAASLSGTEGPGLSATNLQPGTYVFRLTATDNFGDTAFDEATVTVAANQAPVAQAGSDQQLTFPASAVTLTGSGTDSDGSIVSYSWTKQSGPAASLSGADTPTLTASGLVIGSYVFGLTVSDEAGATGYDEVSVTVNPDPSAGPALVSFTLVNASNEQDIRTLVAGETINLATLPTRSLNIRANTNPGVVGSVKMVLSGAQSRSVTESGAPYSLFGDNSGNYLSWTPAAGSYTLSGTPYTSSGGAGTAGTPLTLSFTVIDQAAVVPVVQAGADQTLVLPLNSLTLHGSATDGDGSIVSYRWTQQSGGAATLAGADTPDLQVSALAAGAYTFRLTATDNEGNTSFDEVNVLVQQPAAPGQQVLSFTLVNASNEQDIRTLVAGETINLASLPTQNLNIRANTNPEIVGSVKFALSGPQSKNVVESGAPYALYGDKNGNYNAWVPATGTYTLVATPYTSSGGGGTAGTPLSLSFTVVNQSAAARMDLSATGRTDQAVALRPFPNPSQDGRFQVLLPEAVTGEISYELVSLSGASLAKGKLDLSQPAALLDFDFSRQMQASGMYYLKLQGERFHNQLKLMRK
ncbi:MAG: PKD domain-containing protein, partial [Adhaeribacter sp.]